jgi:hypothetical protein
VVFAPEVPLPPAVVEVSAEEEPVPLPVVAATASSGRANLVAVLIAFKGPRPPPTIPAAAPKAPAPNPPPGAPALQLGQPEDGPPELSDGLCIGIMCTWPKQSCGNSRKLEAVRL